MERPRLVDTPGGVSLEYRGRFLYSRRDPRKGPERIAAEYPLQADTLYLLPSPLLGYGVFTLLDRLPETSLILCVEAERPLLELFKQVLANNKHPARGRLMVLDTLEPDRVYAALVKREHWPYRRLEIITLNGGVSLGREAYEVLRTHLDERIRLAYQDRITKVFLARRWLKNLFTNLGADWGLESYRAIKIEKPVVVAGAGESLEGTLPDLANRREEIYLLAADTALPVLSAAGIIPDATVVLEAQFINMRDFYSSPLNEIDLIADISSFPAVFRLPWRRRFGFASRFAPIKTLDRLFSGPLTGFEFPAYGSVGIAALALARALCTQAIYISGIDFCYRLGKSHARGNQFHLGELAQSSRFSPSGGLRRFFERPLVRTRGKISPVLSDLILLNYRAGLGEYLQDKRDIYDLNPAGLDLGLPSVQLRDANLHPSPAAAKLGLDRKETEYMLDEEGAARFLRGEAAFLELLLREGRRYLQRALAPEESFRTLGEHDYLYAHFPEEYREYPLNPTAVKRLLLAAEGYLAHLQGILNKIL